MQPSQDEAERGAGFNGIRVPGCRHRLVYPVRAMAAMALSVTTIFINSIGRDRRC